MFRGILLLNLPHSLTQSASPIMPQLRTPIESPGVSWTFITPLTTGKKTSATLVLLPPQGLVLQLAQLGGEGGGLVRQLFYVEK